MCGAGEPVETTNNLPKFCFYLLASGESEIQVGDLIEGGALAVRGFGRGEFLHVEAVEGVFNEGGLAEMNSEVTILATLPVESYTQVMTDDAYEIDTSFGM